MGRFAPGFVDVTLFPRALPATNYSIAFNDPSVKFAPDGAWKTKDTASGTAYSNVSTATVTVEFIGSAVWLLSSQKYDRNLLQLTLDGLDVGGAPLYQPASLGISSAQTVIWSKTGLAPDASGNDLPHTLVAVNSPSSDGTKPWASFGGIRYTSNQPQSATGTQVNGPADGTATNAPAAATPSSGNSKTGLIVGVAAAGGLVGLMVLVVLAYWYRRRRQRKEREAYGEVQRVEPYEVIDASTAGRVSLPSGAAAGDDMAEISIGKRIAEQHHGLNSPVGVAHVDEYGRRPTSTTFHSRPDTSSSIAMSSIHVGTPPAHNSGFNLDHRSHHRSPSSASSGGGPPAPPPGAMLPSAWPPYHAQQHQQQNLYDPPMPARVRSHLSSQASSTSVRGSGDHERRPTRDSKRQYITASHMGTHAQQYQQQQPQQPVPIEQQGMEQHEEYQQEVAMPAPPRYEG